MFCENCGYNLGKNEKFCSACGHSITQPKRLKKKANSIVYLFIASLFGGIVVLAILIWFGSTFDEDANKVDQSEEEPSEEDVPAIFTELEPTMKPVGYFDDMSLFDSETISFEEWLSHVQYYDIEEQEFFSTQFPNKKEVFSSVVKIICDSAEYFYYGSGTNFDPSGYVLTNQHVVADVAADECIVGFPDPGTGLIKEAYRTTVIVDKDNVTGHDLAILAIESPLYDEEGNFYGYYDKIKNSTFPYFEYSDECSNASPELGSKVMVLGYPPLSGGALTVTDGLISSLYSQRGYLVTSAKIMSGNSGGLAIDENGCYVGVPTAVYLDEETDGEALGEIIDREFTIEFDNAIEDDLEKYYEANGIKKTH